MTVPATASGGSAASPGGTSETDPKPADPTPQTVSYDSYKKLMDEKKKRDEELRDLKSKEKERQEKDLSDEKNFQELLKLREKELADAKAASKEMADTLERGMKLRALLDSVQGKVEQKYWNLLDLDRIAMNPETKLPDTVSVNALAREFEKTFPEVVRKGNGAGLPNEAAGSTTGRLSYAEWLKLPAKDMRKRMGEVDSSTLPK